MYAAKRSRLPVAGFLLAVTAIVAADALALRSPRLASAPTFGAVAAILDLAVVVPLVWYLIVVRKRLARPTSVIPVAAAGTLLASRVVPGDTAAFTHGIRWLFVAAELGLITYATTTAVRALRRARASGGEQRDFFDHLQEQLRRVVSARAIADAIASEAALVYYALFSWGARSDTPAGARAFTAYKSTGLGALVMVLVGMSAFEIPLVHILLARWNLWAAWIATAAGIYGIVWGIGVYQSIRLRPALLLADALLVRVGLLSAVRVPFAAIERVERARFPHPEKNTAGYLRAVVIGDPALMLHLRSPLTAERLYGLRKDVTLIGIAVDDRAAFESELRARMSGVPNVP